MTKTRRRFRKTGWALVVMGLAMGGGFWLWWVPTAKGLAPDFVPHLSPQGFWQAKERAMKLGVWRHDDGLVTGYFGGREWVGKIIAWLRDGMELGDCANGHPDIALAFITNHEVGGVAEWQRWWEANQGRTQEEWIQQGFAEMGIAVALPPSKEDWPKLLGVLGAAAGPSERSYRDVERLYADHVCYNAYRWLRDSGLDPLKFAMSEEAKHLSVEQRTGLLVYREEERNLFTPPPPGRLAFAPESDWGWLGRGPEDAPWLLKPMPQAVVTVVSLLLILGGWRLVRAHGTAAMGADSEVRAPLN
ncbi:MAG: hypothetical protein U0984_08310 [Prosthecobacter sp.]|nr:hypothetical protein [Prosthecobacter sp.]